MDFNLLVYWLKMQWYRYSDLITFIVLISLLSYGVRLLHEVRND